MHICCVSSVGIKLLTNRLCDGFLSDDILLSSYVLHVFISSTVYGVLFHICTTSSDCNMFCYQLLCILSSICVCVCACAHTCICTYIFTCMSHGTSGGQRTTFQDSLSTMRGVVIELRPSGSVAGAFTCKESFSIPPANSHITAWRLLISYENSALA